MAALEDSRWLRIKSIVADAIDAPPEARAAAIESACAGDTPLRDEVEALVEAHQRAGAFLEAPALLSPGAAERVVEATEGPASAPALPERFGAYRVLGELGRGGMGVVYLGARDDDRFDKRVAIKVVSGDVVHPAVFRRFEDERRILATLDHPNIARLLDAGTTPGGQPFVVMEHVEGDPIDAFCEARRLGVPERLRLFTSVCSAVQYSHQHLVVHRDIKARNILVTADGVPKLLDFGIAKLLEPGESDGGSTRTAFRLLTPESASPEQVRGEPVTVATDVYSLGVLLYRLLTGRGPYRGGMTTDAEIVRAVCEEEPLRPSEAGGENRRDLRGDLDLITLKALRKDPERRYTSVEQVAQDVQRHLDNQPVLAAPDAWTYRARKFATRHWVGLAAAAAVTLALLGGGAAAWWQARRAERRFNDVRKLAHTFMFDVHDGIAKLPGSTPVRKLLVAEALTYLDSLALEAGGDPALQRELAAGYEKMADVLGRPGGANLGDASGALATYRKVQVARERLLSADPGNRELRHDMAATGSKIALLLYRQGDLPGAVEEARRAVVAEEALASSPLTESEALRLAASHTAYGYLLGPSGRWLEAIEHLRKAIALIEPLPASPAAQLQLQQSYTFLGDVLEVGARVPGVLPDAKALLEVRRRALALAEPLAQADPLDSTYQRRVFSGFLNMGGVLTQMGDRRAAVDHYRRGLAHAARMSEADPINLNARRDLAYIGTLLGTVLAQDGDTTEALPLLERSAGLLEAVLAADPEDLGPRGVAAENNLGQGYAHLALGSSAALTANVRRAHWREAKARFQAAGAFWLEMGDRGMAVGEEAAKPEAIAREIARCDAALQSRQP